MKDTIEEKTIAAVQRFLDALGSKDFETLEKSMSSDCVFEDVGPPRTGEKHVGAKVIADFFRRMYDSAPDSKFHTEDTFAAGDRCVVMWDYHWTRDGMKGYSRGIDVFRVIDGKVSEKLAYSKIG